MSIVRTYYILKVTWVGTKSYLIFLSGSIIRCMVGQGFAIPTISLPLVGTSRW